MATLFGTCSLNDNMENFLHRCFAMRFALQPQPEIQSKQLGANPDRRVQLRQIRGLLLGQQKEWTLGREIGTGSNDLWVAQAQLPLD